jgi:hypothetical protein
LLQQEFAIYVAAKCAFLLHLLQQICTPFSKKQIGSSFPSDGGSFPSEVILQQVWFAAAGNFAATTVEFNQSSSQGFSLALWALWIKFFGWFTIFCRRAIRLLAAMPIFCPN